jgi:LmbE family N-acetylglucosaminyl deacetylase
MDPHAQGELANSLASLSTASDLLAAEVAQLSTSLGERAGWSARVTAAHAEVGARAAAEAADALARAEAQTHLFLAAAESLRGELDTLHQLDASVKAVLAAVGRLEIKTNQVVQKQHQKRHQDKKTATEQQR